MGVFPSGSTIPITKMSMLNTDFLLISSQLVIKQVQCIYSYGANDVASASNAAKFLTTCTYLHQTVLCTSDKNTRVTSRA